MWNNIKTVANALGTIFGIAMFYTWAYDRGRQSLKKEIDGSDNVQEQNAKHRITRDGDVITIDLSDFTK